MLRAKVVARRVGFEITAARRLSADRRSFFRWSSDIVIYRLLRLAPGLGGRVRTIRLADGSRVTYRLSRGDILTLREVWVDEVYADPVGGPVRTLVDLGANIGLSSIWLATRHQCDRVVAVEPLPANVDLLHRNLQQNGIRATVIAAAVGAQSGTGFFAESSEPNSGALAPHGLPVEIVAMDRVLRSFGRSKQIDLVKVDIEGTEQELLGSSPDWLTSVRRVVVEIHEPPADATKIEAALRAAGLEPTSGLPGRPPEVRHFHRSAADGGTS